AISAGGVTSAAIAAEVSSHVRLAIPITAKLPRINSVALLQGVMVSSLGFTALHAGFGETSASMQRSTSGPVFRCWPHRVSGREACMLQRRSSRLLSYSDGRP